MMSRQSMASIRRRKHMLWAFTGFLACLSIGILLMPIGSINKEKTMLLLYFSGAAFWIGLIGTLYMTFKINRSRKGSYRFNEQFGNQKQFGLLHFFQNKEAMIADVGMFISIIGFILTKICSGNLAVLFVFLALFVFTLGMHCLLNGINYRYLKYDSSGR